MLNLNSEQIANYLDVDYAGPLTQFESVTTDSREVQPASLFVALVGERHNGHDYCQQALSSGATGLLISQELDFEVPDNIVLIKVDNTLWAYGQVAALYRARFKIPMVGITGSCGKSTVKQMLGSIVSQVAESLISPNSYNNEIGLPKTLLMLEPKHKYAVLEMGARKTGDIKYLMELVNPSVSMVNNAAPVHIETFGSIDNVAATKGEIYRYLQPNGTAVVNVDDQYAPFWLSSLNSQNVVTFGLECAADVTCAYYVEEHHQIRFELVTDIGTLDVNLPMIGKHNVMNALAATALARALDIGLDAIKAGLESVATVDRRLQLKDGVNGSRVIDDSYNANPTAMRSAIDVLARQAQRKILVLADMLELGDLAAEQHDEIGSYARARGVDLVMACGDLARHTVNAFGEQARFFNDKKSLIAELKGLLDANTVVLVKASNGMQMDEVVQAIAK